MSIQDAGEEKLPSRFRAPSETLPWTDARTAKLAQLYSEGLSYTQIVKELGGATKGSVAGKIATLGLTREKTAPKPEISPKKKSDARSAGVAFKLKRPKTQPATTPVPELKRDDAFLGIDLVDLEFNHCRFPHGEGRATLFCGQPKQKDSSYCPHHHKLTHNGIPASRPSAAEKRMRANATRHMEHDARRVFP